MKELPNSWAVCKLGEILTIQNGYAFSSKDFKDKGVPLIRQSNLAGKCISLDKCVYLDPVFLETKKDFILKKNDVLIGMSGSIGKLCIYNLDQPALQNQRTGKINLLSKDIVDWRFIWEYLKTIESELKGKSKGLGVNNVSGADIESLQFIIPPVNEQRRIVTKLEKLLAKVDACKERLEKIPAILKRFRQSVLAAACAGDLTRDWRNEKTTSNFNQQKKCGYFTKDSKENFEISNSSTSLRLLPNTWEWVALGNYAELSRGRFSARPRNDPKYFDGKHPFIQIGDLPKDGGFISSHRQTLNDLGLSVSKKFPTGTVVIAIVGATIGNTGILSYEMCFPDSLVGINTGTSTGNVFIELFLRTEKEKLRTISYSSGGQPNIKLETLNPYPFPCSPIDEQHEIVRRVEALFKIADDIEKRYRKAKVHVDKLTQSILAKAFRGELVPQDPDDEPASELLKRIQVERKNQEAEARPGRKSTRRRARPLNTVRVKQFKK